MACPAHASGRKRLTRSSTGVRLSAFLCAIAVSFYFSGFIGVFTQKALRPGWNSSASPPNCCLRTSHWRSCESLVPLIQTIAISLIGTLIGVLFGGLLSITATSRLVFAPTDGPGINPPLIRMRNAIYWTSRLVLSVLRSIPELVWRLWH